MIRKILSTKDPALSKISKPVKKVDKKIGNLVKDLKDTLVTQKDPEGVALAAPQIGVNLKVFVMRDNGKIREIINPKIINISKSKQKEAEDEEHQIMEGCLSLPGYYGSLLRAKKVKISFLNLKGEKKIEEFKDFSAQIVQHEMDHLRGKIFIERILIKKKPLYKLENEEWVEVEL